MITIYRWKVTTENGAFVATGIMTGTKEEAEAAAMKAAYPSGTPQGLAERNYRFEYEQITKPRNHEHRRQDNDARTEEARIHKNLQRRRRGYNF